MCLCLIKRFTVHLWNWQMSRLKRTGVHKRFGDIEKTRFKIWFGNMKWPNWVALECSYLCRTTVFLSAVSFMWLCTNFSTWRYKKTNFDLKALCTPFRLSRLFSYCRFLVCRIILYLVLLPSSCSDKNWGLTFSSDIWTASAASNTRQICPSIPGATLKLRFSRDGVVVGSLTVHVLCLLIKAVEVIGVSFPAVYRCFDELYGWFLRKHNRPFSSMVFQLSDDRSPRQDQLLYHQYGQTPRIVYQEPIPTRFIVCEG